MKDLLNMSQKVDVINREATMNSFLKQFLIVGVPIVIFFTVFFSLLIGTDEGLVHGLVIGLFVGGLLSLILGFFYSKPAKNLMLDCLEDLKSRPHKLRNLTLTFLPYVILFLGAIFTRASGQIFVSYVVTIISSITVYTLYFYYLGEFKKEEGNLTAYVARIIILLIPLSVSYFIFLFVVYGFDFNKIKGLF